MFLRNLSASSTARSRKIANLRYQHASEMRAELQRLKRDSGSGKKVAAEEPAEELASGSSQSDSSQRAVQAPSGSFAWCLSRYRQRGQSPP